VSGLGPIMCLCAKGPGLHWEREDLLHIQVHLMEQVGTLQAAIYNLQADCLGGQANPIVLDSNSKRSESGEDADVEMAVGDKISLWSQDVNGRDGWSTQATLVGDQVLYDLVLIKELGR
jgi:hypothetical protein